MANLPRSCKEMERIVANRVWQQEGKTMLQVLLLIDIWVSHYNTKEGDFINNANA